MVLLIVSGVAKNDHLRYTVSATAVRITCVGPRKKCTHQFSPSKKKCSGLLFLAFSLNKN